MASGQYACNMRCRTYFAINVSHVLSCNDGFRAFFHLYAGIGGGEVTQLLARIQRHEVQLWSLLDAQYELKTSFDGLRHGIGEPLDAASHLAESIEHILGQYEVQTWQIVPIQLQLRLKLMQLEQFKQFDSIQKKSEAPERFTDGNVGYSNGARTRHGSERSFTGAIYAKRFAAKADVAKHGRMHGKGNVECGLAGASPPKSSGCPDAHLQASRHFLCEECGHDCRSKAELKRHTFEKHHPIADMDTRPARRCTVCDQQFRTKSQHLLHMRRMHNGERPFQCDICGDRFVVKLQLTAHMSKHSGVMPYACDQCDKRFPWPSSLSKHQQTKHAHVPPAFKCDVCARQFIFEHVLRRHQRAHTGERPFQCDICQKRFFDMAAIRRHMRRHTGARPHACDVCQKTFICVKYLKIHQKMHSEQMLFTCDQCGKRFRAAGNLKLHQQIHHSEQPPTFQCDICQRNLYTVLSLARHRRTHTGEKPYACEVCHKRFADLCYVKVHMRLHTGEMPYACDVCDRRFLDKRNMAKHKKIHTK